MHEVQASFVHSPYRPHSRGRSHPDGVLVWYPLALNFFFYQIRVHPCCIWFDLLFSEWYTAVYHLHDSWWSYQHSFCWPFVEGSASGCRYVQLFFGFFLFWTKEVDNYFLWRCNGFLSGLFYSFEKLGSNWRQHHWGSAFKHVKALPRDGNPVSAI